MLKTSTMTEVGGGGSTLYTVNQLVSLFFHRQKYDYSTRRAEPLILREDPYLFW